MANADLFIPLAEQLPFIEPWKPIALTHDQWPPDYRGVIAWRIACLEQLRRYPDKLADARRYYRTRPAEFIMHWMDTFNPRKERLKWMPFVFFERQEQFVAFLEELRRDKENGLVEKCRDIGATWLACAYSVWCWLFIDGDATGWGSRKQELVDKLGDPDSIFEKMRLLVRRLPDIWLPEGFKWRDHATFTKFVNPANGATITGESGDNIGRGGRKSRYFKDEAQPLDAKILTPFGWQTMGEMQIGSLVCGPKGDWRAVTHINECGEFPIYRITLSDGTSTECSEGHLWTLADGRIVRTTGLLKEYKYKSPGGQVQYRCRLPEIELIEFVGRGNYPLHPYIVGALIGDGSIAKVPLYRPAFTTADDEIAQQFEQLLPADCVIKKDTNRAFAYRLGDRQGRRGQGKISRMSLAIVAAGIAGCLAHEKFVPDAYKFGSVEDRLSLLQGLMDTDGSASGGTLTYHTCSRRLADDVRFIVRSLGGSASLNVKPDHRGFRDMYCLHVALPKKMIPFRLSRKIAEMKQPRGAFGRTIINVEYVGTKAVRCITVNAKDGLYLTDYCIPTHNSAHYERPEKIEAALGDNTDIQIDISSVNGLGNVFHRRRESGIVWHPGAQFTPGMTRVFVFDWRDHPEKTQEWYEQRKAKAEREGMQHIFAQEVDRNYSAAVQNTLIPHEWIVAAVDAHLSVPALRVPPPDVWMAGLDVADEGLDRNALALRQWVILRHVEEWGERDVGVTTRRMVAALRERRGIKVQYDSIGVGSGVKAEYNRLIADKIVTRTECDLVPWNAGGKVVNPFDRVIPDDEGSLLNRDFFGNFKAQAWWSVRTRFYKTWRAVTLGEIYNGDELISLDSSMPLLQQLMKELATPTQGTSTGLRMIVDKKPNGVRSPNLADAVIQAFFPAPEAGGTPVVGSYSG